MWSVYEIEYADVKTARNTARKYRKNVRHLISAYRSTGDRLAYAMIGQALLLYRMTNMNYQVLLSAYAETVLRSGRHV